MVSTKVDLCGMTLDNPVMAASGTFGYGYEFAELFDINMLGTFSFKGHDAGTEIRQPDAENSRMPGRDDKFYWLAEPGQSSGSSMKNCRSWQNVYIKKLWQT